MCLGMCLPSKHIFLQCNFQSFLFANIPAESIFTMIYSEKWYYVMSRKILVISAKNVFFS